MKALLNDTTMKKIKIGEDELGGRIVEEMTTKEFFIFDKIRELKGIRFRVGSIIEEMESELDRLKSDRIENADETD